MHRAVLHESSCYEVLLSCCAGLVYVEKEGFAKIKHTKPWFSRYVDCNLSPAMRCVCMCVCVWIHAEIAFTRSEIVLDDAVRLSG